MPWVIVCRNVDTDIRRVYVEQGLALFGLTIYLVTFVLVLVRQLGFFILKPEGQVFDHNFEPLPFVGQGRRQRFVLAQHRLLPLYFYAQ